MRPSGPWKEAPSIVQPSCTPLPGTRGQSRHGATRVGLEGLAGETSSTTGAGSGVNTCGSPTSPEGCTPAWGLFDSERAGEMSAPTISTTVANVRLAKVSREHRVLWRRRNAANECSEVRCTVSSG